MGHGQMWDLLGRAKCSAGLFTAASATAGGGKHGVGTSHGV